ncbi:MAG: DsbC family protein, partial [Burkholderiales bacterium]|nr:DsbC family protein [Burkholderiales bacterium]
MKPLYRLLTLAAAGFLALGAQAQTPNPEAQIRRALAERIPSLPKIDEVRPTAIPGLYEVRLDGTEIVYSDAKGEFLIQGALIDTRTMTNLTQARIDKLTAIDFSSLPFKDAMVFKQGNGARKMAVFVDPNCTYCKRFEGDLVKVKDVTIYTFIMPILGPDSRVKARDIWCSKEASATWRAWMLDGVPPPRAMGPCDAGALERNVAFGHKFKI